MILSILEFLMTVIIAILTIPFLIAFTIIATGLLGFLVIKVGLLIMGLFSKK